MKSTLAQIQNQFYTAILTKNDPDLNFVGSQNPTKRFSIYQQNIYGTLKNSLALTFPGIFTLLGEPCANNVAFAFYTQTQNLPTSEYLDDWGADFPQFLSTVSELDHLPYLQEYGLYEWQRHLSYYAAESEPLPPTAFKKIPEDKINSIRLSFIPSVFLYACHFPIAAIQEIIENPNAPPITLTNPLSKSYVVIARASNHPFAQVQTFWIAEDQFLFFQALNNHSTLQEALNRISPLFPNFDLSAAFVFLLKHQLISKFL